MASGVLAIAVAAVLVITLSSSTKRAPAVQPRAHVNALSRYASRGTVGQQVNQRMTEASGVDGNPVDPPNVTITPITAPSSR